MRKMRIKVLNNKYVIAYYIKLVKVQMYFNQAKSYDQPFYQFLINVVLTC